MADSATQSASTNYLQVGSNYSATTGYAVEAGKISTGAS
jgi:hypothetical protein